jgi:endonuclease/exonuclease/phosphatase (EEP) superfamily protein YafD
MVRGFLNWTLPPALALGLLSLGTLAPISDLWDKVFSWIAISIMLVYVGVPMWEYHRERQADQSSSAATSSSDQT